MSSGGDTVEINSTQGKPRRPIACNFCRVKKVRCDGGQPCKNCVDHGEDCQSASKQRSRVKKKDSANNAMAQRMARLESLLQTMSDSSPNDPRYPSKLEGYNEALWDLGQMSAPQTMFLHESSSTLPNSVMQANTFSQQEPTPISIQRARSQDFACGSGLGATDCVAERPPKAFPSPCPTPPFHPPSSACFKSASPAATQSIEAVRPIGFVTLAQGEGLRRDGEPSLNNKPTEGTACTPEEEQEGNSVYFGENSNWEYHEGPRSYLSICSKPGIQWVALRTGSETFQDSASMLTEDITRRLKIERHLSRERMPEPNYEVAQKYVQAYFEGSPEAPFGIVNRARFESRLQAHFQGSDPDDDPAWFALRNAVFASGCRVELARTGTFGEACQTSWGFFGNALSVHTELLYFRTSLLAIQALAVMAYFTDSMGSPCLEYMLSTIALRLACSKGLHRQAVSSWNISPHEEAHRNRLFWAVYCLEKHASSRSGRPSMLNDDQINCQYPTRDHPGTTTNVAYCNIIIRLAQMVSRVSQTLSSIETFRQPPQTLAAMVAQLDGELKLLEGFIKPVLDLDSPTAPPALGTGISFQQAIYIRLSYYSIFLDIHTVLTNPWSRSALDFREHPNARSQVEKSTEAVAKMARKAILAAQHIHIDATTPLLLSFFGPIYALINLFIHVLEDPGHATVQSDLALMEIGAAHFSRVEFSTELPFPFAKDIASLARTAVKRQKELLSQPMHGANHFDRPPSGVSSGTGTVVEIGEQGCYETDTTFKDGYPSNFFDLEFEHWSTFLPTPGFNYGLTSSIGQ